MKFILTIDTEGDNQWDHGRELSVENVKYLPRFQNLCEKYLIKPTYLVTSEVCEDPFAREIFTEYLLNDKAEIGTHLHSWTTPPFHDATGYRFNDNNHAFATELSDEMLRQKLKNLTDQIEDSFGLRPLSFRSGRFGFDKHFARILVDNSYLVDSSVTPFIDWSDTQGIPGGSGGPNFSNFKPFPFTFDFDSGSLFEIPVTILPTRFPLNRFDYISGKYFKNVNKNIFLKFIRKIIFQNQPLWLRPLPDYNINTFRELLSESMKIQLPFIVMMFHSSELMPGCSRYRIDEKSIEELYYLLEQFFIMLKEENITSVSLKEAALNCGK